MFILTSEDKPSVITHTTNSWALSQVVKEYIESRHDCSIQIKEHKGLVYYDCPGPAFLNPELFFVSIGKVETKVENVDMLICYFNKTPDFAKGFMRIPSFYTHVCLSQHEFEETKQFITDNKQLIDEYIETADKIIFKKLNEVKNAT